MSILSQLITPRDCALAVGLPWTESEFLSGFEEAAGKDLAQSIVRRHRGLSPRMCWREIYEPLARLLGEVAAEAAALGVMVCRPTTLASLAQLYQSAAVVTLLAHWRFVPISADDIHDGAGLLRVLENPTSALVEQIAQHLALQQPDGGLGLHNQLAASLNRLLSADTLRYEQGHYAPTGPAEKPRIHFSRAMLEQCFPGHLRARPAIELSDGMHTVADFVSAVPVNYSGLIDLSVCNSIVMAEAIKRQRRECMVLSNVYPARLVLRLLRYRYLMRLLAERPALYQDAVLRLSAALTKS